MGEAFSDRCEGLLTGRYDCVDRIVLNALLLVGVFSGWVPHLVAAVAGR
jgi:hypothetical protein